MVHTEQGRPWAGQKGDDILRWGYLILILLLISWLCGLGQITVSL